jgi:hypothetical protein
MCSKAQLYAETFYFEHPRSNLILTACHVQCFGFKFGLDLDFIGSPDRESGSGSRQAQIVPPKKEKIKKFHVFEDRELSL